MKLNQITIQEKQILAQALRDKLDNLTYRIDINQRELDEDKQAIAKGEKPRNCVLDISWYEKLQEKRIIEKQLTQNLYKKITGEDYGFVPF